MSEKRRSSAEDGGTPESDDDPTGAVAESVPGEAAEADTSERGDPRERSDPTGRGEPSERAEPPENISGGAAGGGSTERFEPATADTDAERIVDRLGELYWQKSYGGRAAFPCLVRTILSQNTSDVASQPAHDALVERYDEPATELAKALAAADRERLAETIRSAGLYNQKARMIQDAAAWVLERFGSAAAFDEYVSETDAATVRDELLDVRGVGPKTADCVLLFAGGRAGVFPVDTHVHRIARRLGLAPPDADHEGVREALERSVPGSKCGFGHTAMIQFGREYCSARAPACLDGPEACPLYDECDRVGVDPDERTVVDPEETVPST